MNDFFVSFQKGFFITVLGIVAAAILLGPSTTTSITRSYFDTLSSLIQPIQRDWKQYDPCPSDTDFSKSP